MGILLVIAMLFAGPIGMYIISTPDAVCTSHPRDHQSCSLIRGLPRDSCYPLARRGEYEVSVSACPAGAERRYGGGWAGREVKCKTESHADGSWSVCETPKVRSASCVVYAFGVGFDPSFDIEFAASHPNCMVHSFDPTPGKTVQLMQNLSINHKFHPWGLAKQTQFDVEFKNFWTGEELAAGRIKEHPKVSMYSIADLNRKLGVTPTVVKLDIEGFEFDLIADCAKQLEVEQILVELHYNKPAMWRSVLDNILAQGFQLYAKEAGRFAECGDKADLTALFTHENCVACNCPGALQEFQFVRPMP